MWRTAARENTTIPQAEGFPGTWTELLLDIQVIRSFVILGSPTHVKAMAIQIINIIAGLSIHWREREAPADPQDLRGQALFFPANNLSPLD